MFDDKMKSVHYGTKVRWLESYWEGLDDGETDLDKYTVYMHVIDDIKTDLEYAGYELDESMLKDKNYIRGMIHGYVHVIKDLEESIKDKEREGTNE